MRFPWQAAACPCSFARCNAGIRMAINTGRVHLGSKMAMREIQHGRAKMAIVSSNCPEETRKRIENHCRLAGVQITRHPKDSLDLGVLCGRPHPVSAIVINDPGDSKILNLVKVEDA